MEGASHGLYTLILSFQRLAFNLRLGTEIIHDIAKSAKPAWCLLFQGVKPAKTFIVAWLRHDTFSATRGLERIREYFPKRDVDI